MQASSPEIVLILLASAMLLAGTFAPAPCRCWFWCSIASLIVTGIAFAFAARIELPASSVLASDGLAKYGKLLLLITGIALILLSDGMALHDAAPEYFACLLLTIAGAML